MAHQQEWWKPEAPWPKREQDGKTVVVTGARLIDGNGGAVLDNPVIVLKGGASNQWASKAKYKRRPTPKSSTWRAAR